MRTFIEALFVILKNWKQSFLIAQLVKAASLIAQLVKNWKQNSLEVQWLGRCTFTARAWVPSLVGELRSYKP